MFVNGIPGIHRTYRFRYIHLLHKLSIQIDMTLNFIYLFGTSRDMSLHKHETSLLSGCAPFSNS